MKTINNTSTLIQQTAFYFYNRTTSPTDLHPKAHEKRENGRFPKGL